MEFSELLVARCVYKKNLKHRKRTLIKAAGTVYHMVSRHYS